MVQHLSHYTVTRSGCRARATALEKGVDAVLDPLLDSVEKAIPQSQHLTWATMELEDLYTLLKAAAQTHVALKKCSNAVESLLGLMLAIQKTAQANKVAHFSGLHLIFSCKLGARLSQG